MCLDFVGSVTVGHCAGICAVSASRSQAANNMTSPVRTAQARKERMIFRFSAIAFARPDKRQNRDIEKGILPTTFVSILFQLGWGACAWGTYRTFVRKTPKWLP